MTGFQVNRHHPRPVAYFCIHHSDFCLNNPGCRFDVGRSTLAVPSLHGRNTLGVHNLTDRASVK